MIALKIINYEKEILTMTNEIKIFESPEFGKVRTEIINGEPWFVGKDVATALDYKNSSKALKDNVDEEDKGITKVTTSGGKQNVVIINESGLYALVFGCKLEKAKKFKHWVTSEVLPTLRKTGSYSMPQTNGEKIKLIAQGYEELDNRVTEIDDRVKTLEDRLNVVGAFDNEKYLNQIRGATHSRVAILTKDPTNKVLWTHYFYTAIYGLLKKIYEVSTIKSIPVSATESAIGLIEHWTPSDAYLENRINKMKSEMEENLLPDKKTIAFLQYMRNTDDGKINPFKHL